MIDAHVHLWRIGEHGFAWPPPDLEAIHRDVELPELRALATANGVDSVVLVQSQEAAVDTEWLLSLADDPLVLGVVGWSDLRGPLPSHPKLKGLRPMVQDLADDWYDDPAIDAALIAMAERGLVLDALIRPRHLPALHRLAARHPALSIVIDHAAKPDVGDLARWEAEMRAIAERPNVACKVSGLVTEPGMTPRIGEVAGTVIDAFGTDRLIWGSDWPVLTLAEEYAPWLAHAQALIAPSARDAVFGGNAGRIYALSGC
ncbi:amidohydrolase [Sphingomonas sp.]|uniref:amidohydrolase family protein n=1 Tax=Sphingomonas sp. TaxID=28214 RepID=UPI0025F96578|nr:amidohydrolase family protein [Sphingomonas sp.]